MKFINTYLFIFVLCICGCSTYPEPKEFTVNRSYLPTLITANIGDAIIVEVKTNASTGYRWFMTGADKVVLLESRNTTDVANNNKLIIGKANTEKITLRCVNRGICVVYFEYKRPWEKTCVDKFEIKIKVE